MKAFDTKAANLIGKIPQSFECSLVWLGKFTTPLLWVGYVALIHMLLLSPGRIEGDVLVLVIVMPLASVMKLFFRRKRPVTIYTESMKIKSYSFPSSHAYAAALAGGYLSVVATTYGSVLLGVAFALVAVLVGISRIRIGAHYPSDVVGGWALGIVALLIILIR